MKLFLYGLLAAGLLTACTKEVDYNYDFPGDAIAVVARIDPAEGVTAYVTRGVPPQGTFDLPELTLPDARVEVVTEEGTRLRADFVSGAEFRYPVDSAITAGRRYRLEVTHPDYPPVVSEWVTIPSVIPDVVIERRGATDPFSGNEVSELSFTGLDSTGTDYYLVESYPAGSYRAHFQVRLNADFDTEFCELYNYHLPYGIFFPDLCFNGEDWSFTLAVDEKEFLGGNSPVVYDQFVFAVRHIDATYWSYQLDRLNLDDIRGSILEAISPSTSNVIGGYGVFLASNSIVRLFPVR